jgi:hypothetical protein
MTPTAEERYEAAKRRAFDRLCNEGGHEAVIYPFLKEEMTAAIREAEAAGEARGRAMERKRVKNALDIRLNDYLCEMREGYDDSIVGFNEAWDVVRKCFESIRARTDKESSDD